MSSTGDNMSFLLPKYMPMPRTVLLLMKVFEAETSSYNLLKIAQQKPISHIYRCCVDGSKQHTKCIMIFGGNY